MGNQHKKTSFLKNWQSEVSEPQIYTQTKTLQQARQHMILIRDLRELKNYASRINEKNKLLTKILYYHVVQNILFDIRGTYFHIYSQSITSLQKILSVSPSQQEQPSEVIALIQLKLSLNILPLLTTFHTIFLSYGPISITSSMIGLTTSPKPQLRVWINENPALNYPQIFVADEQEMVEQLLKVIRGALERNNHNNNGLLNGIEKGMKFYDVIRIIEDRLSDKESSKASKSSSFEGVPDKSNNFQQPKLKTGYSNCQMDPKAIPQLKIRHQPQSLIVSKYESGQHSVYRSALRTNPRYIASDCISQDQLHRNSQLPNTKPSRDQSNNDRTHSHSNNARYKDVKNFSPQMRNCTSYQKKYSPSRVIMPKLNPNPFSTEGRTKTDYNKDQVPHNHDYSYRINRYPIESPIKQTSFANLLPFNRHSANNLDYQQLLYQSPKKQGNHHLFHQSGSDKVQSYNNMGLRDKKQLTWGKRDRNSSKSPQGFSQKEKPIYSITEEGYNNIRQIQSLKPILNHKSGKVASNGSGIHKKHRQLTNSNNFNAYYLNQKVLLSDKKSPRLSNPNHPSLPNPLYNYGNLNSNKQSTLNPQQRSQVIKGSSGLINFDDFAPYMVESKRIVNESNLIADATLNFNSGHISNVIGNKSQKNSKKSSNIYRRQIDSPTLSKEVQDSLIVVKSWNTRTRTQDFSGYKSSGKNTSAHIHNKKKEGNNSSMPVPRFIAKRKNSESQTEKKDPEDRQPKTHDQFINDNNAQKTQDGMITPKPKSQKLKYVKIPSNQAQLKYVNHPSDFLSSSPLNMEKQVCFSKTQNFGYTVQKNYHHGHNSSGSGSLKVEGGGKNMEIKYQEAICRKHGEKYNEDSPLRKQKKNLNLNLSAIQIPKNQQLFAANNVNRTFKQNVTSVSNCLMKTHPAEEHQEQYGVEEVIQSVVSNCVAVSTPKFQPARRDPFLGSPLSTALSIHPRRNPIKSSQIIQPSHLTQTYQTNQNQTGYIIDPQFVAKKGKRQSEKLTSHNLMVHSDPSYVDHHKEKNYRRIINQHIQDSLALDSPLKNNLTINHSPTGYNHCNKIIKDQNQVISMSHSAVIQQFRPSTQQLQKELKRKNKQQMVKLLSMEFGAVIEQSQNRLKDNLTTNQKQSSQTETQRKKPIPAEQTSSKDENRTLQYSGMQSIQKERDRDCSVIDEQEHKNLFKKIADRSKDQIIREKVKQKNADFASLKQQAMILLYND